MFHTYQHMDNSYNIVEKYTNVLSKYYIDPELKWYAQEKIHGTNFSIIYDNVTMIPCKRNSTLENDPLYYNHGPLMIKYKEDIISIFKFLKTKYDNLLYIQIYCELFGGIYDRITEKNSKKVQDGVYYCCNNDILVYDISITTNTMCINASPTTTKYIDFEELIIIFTVLKLQLKMIPIMMSGTLQELMLLDPKFESKIYKLYNLHQLDNNYAEGFVLHSAIEQKTCYGERLNFKYKNSSFDEIIEKNIKQLPKEVKILTQQQEYLKIFKNYITKNRFNNLFTKLDSKDNKILLVQMMIDDIIQDIMIDYKDDINICNNDNIIDNKKECITIITSFVKKMFS